MKNIILLAILLMSAALFADQNSDENQLLESWGFQVDTQGELVFNAVKQSIPQYQPWNPDVSVPPVADPANKPQIIIDLLAEAQTNYGLWANVLDWVAKTEPLVYPMGNILRYNLLDGFGFD